MDFPYQADYAKSSRASCRNCKGNIAKGSLRLAVIIQSPSFDGKITHWYHYMCFFSKQQPKSVEDIASFDSLRWDDQQKIKEKIEKGGDGKSKKNANKDFSVEYSKSSRATCKGCEEKILKDVVRISKKDYESEKSKRFGPVPMWHHIDCFVKLRDELEFFDSGDMLPGFNTLSADDKKLLRQKIKKLDKKRKASEEIERATKVQKTDNDDLKQQQNKKMFSFRDRLKRNMKKSELNDLLEYNGYSSLSGIDHMLDVLADLMTFGVIAKCDVCKHGRFTYKFGVGYTCNGNLTEWTKCTNVDDAPKRKEFKIPDNFREAFPFLQKYKYKANGNRVVTKREVLPEKTPLQRRKTTKPLEGLRFYIDLKSSPEKDAAKDRIKSLGGGVSSSIRATTAAIVTTEDMIDSKEKPIMQAQQFNIDCVPKDFLDEFDSMDVIELIQKKNMAPWANQTEARISKLLKGNLKSGRKKESEAESSKSQKTKIALKDGGLIDSKSGLADNCHVYKRSGNSYSVVLGMVDLARGLNSYYKIQILEADNKRQWYVYRSWGRIGTKVGDYKLETCEDPNDALLSFNEQYEKRTGNIFTDKTQTKLPGMWYPLDIDYGENETCQKLEAKSSQSKLPLAVKELISLLFDVNSMKNMLVEYEIDLKKMPLGKLSQKQLEDAYKVLSEVMEWLKKLEESEDVKREEKPSGYSEVQSHLLDCSNRFYTLIPHDFGMKNPPLLDSVKMIQDKIEMIDSLREIELAYNLLKCETGESSQDPIDECYKKLKTNISVLPQSSDEFKLIKSSVENTHASTHSHYTLEIEEVFKIEREGEKRRFKPFKKLHNRQLLWHGSRLTNYAGILSQGLRIAPPEAPSTGYMFGKGVYFADMVSKSANYCFTSKSNPTGLLLLCDVALGDMLELTNAKSITKLPPGKHSTKGLGRTCPDPTKSVKIEDGLEMHLGEGQDSGVKKSSLLYNEFIVYDVAQINVKYLLKTNFKYNI